MDATANPPKSDDKNGQEMFKKCSRNVQLIRGSFGKEILLLKFSIHYPVRFSNTEVFVFNLTNTE